VTRPGPIEDRASGASSGSLAFCGVRGHGDEQGHHLELFRVTPEGRIEHRWFPRTEDRDDPYWSGWVDFPFRGRAVDVAAVSAWPEHLEVFVLDAEGKVWNRFWWLEGRWNPDSFRYLGKPFASAQATAIAAASWAVGHMDVQVEAVDRRVRNIWYDGNRWRYRNEETSEWWEAWE
jgi:hypothetical protein